MSAQFYTLTIKEVRRETADCVSISFEVPQQLQEKFTYKSGQYLTVRKFIDGAEQRRSYSLCSAAFENEWRIAVKQVVGGLFSTYANTQLTAGDELEVMPPMGSFTLSQTNFETPQKIVAIAAGSGITPVLSIIKSVLHYDANSHVTLIYGNRNRSAIIFKEAIEDLKNKYMHRFSVLHILSREITDAAINTGRIDAAKCNDIFTRHVDINATAFFICGPEDMTFCVKDFLLQKGVERNRVHFELFTASTSTKKKAATNNSNSSNIFESKVTVKQDGIAFNFALAYDGENILDAALHHGVDLPYSCKGGVCSTCRAKLLQGQVDMETNYALEPEEVANGYILTCQSHPKTPQVVIDFDVK